PSTVATTTAPVRWPTTLVVVRNMSGMRSKPRSSESPASGSPVAANAGTRLTMLAEGTLATVSDVRNTAAPAGRTKLATVRENATQRQGQDPTDDQAQRPGRDVGELREQLPLVIGEPGRRDAKDCDEGDQGKEISLDRRSRGVRRDRLDVEARSARDLLRGM